MVTKKLSNVWETSKPTALKEIHTQNISKKNKQVNKQQAPRFKKGVK